MNPPRKWQSISRGLGCTLMILGTILVCLTFSLSVFSWLQVSPRYRWAAFHKHSTPAKAHIELNHSPDMAYVMSYEWVKQRLVSPGSADFPYKPDSCVQLKPRQWKIKAYCDSQNRFGALIRTYYSCVMTNTHDDAWTCTNLELYER